MISVFVYLVETDSLKKMAPAIHALLGVLDALMIPLVLPAYPASTSMPILVALVLDGTVKHVVQASMRKLLLREKEQENVKPAQLNITAQNAKEMLISVQLAKLIMSS